MIPTNEARRLVSATVRGQKMSRHDKLVMGLVFRHERLRRIEPGGMYNRDGQSVPPELISLRRRQIERTECRERKLWAEMCAAGLEVRDGE